MTYASRASVLAVPGCNSGCSSHGRETAPWCAVRAGHTGPLAGFGVCRWFFREGMAHHTAGACLNAFVNVSYREAEHIVVISQGMKALRIKRGVRERKVTVIHDWAGPPGDRPLEVPPRKPGEPLRIMDAGNVGPPQGLDNVVRALALLLQEESDFTVIGQRCVRSRLVTWCGSPGLSGVVCGCGTPRCNRPRRAAPGVVVHLVLQGREPTPRGVASEPQ